MKYTISDVDRHGKLRRYFRYPGLPKLRLPVDQDSEEFRVAYQKALAEVVPTHTHAKKFEVVAALTLYCDRGHHDDEGIVIVGDSILGCRQQAYDAGWIIHLTNSTATCPECAKHPWRQHPINREKVGRERKMNGQTGPEVPPSPK